MKICRRAEEELLTREDDEYDLASVSNSGGESPNSHKFCKNPHGMQNEESLRILVTANIPITERTLRRRLEPLKREIWQQLCLAGPVGILNIMEYLTTMVALIFVGHLGKVEYAGAALATSMTISLGYILLIGMSTGMETLCGQAYGAQEYYMLGIFLQQGFIVLLISCLPLSILFVNMERLLLLFKQNPQICQMAGKYALGLLPSLFARAILNPLATFLQMQSIVWPEVCSSTIAIAFHLVACWVTIYKFGWGFIGAAISTSVSSWVNVGILVLYIKFSGVCKNTWLGFSKNCIHGIKHFLKLSIPSSVMICSDDWHYAILTLLAGLLPNPEREIFVLNICVNILSLCYMIPLGIGIATSLRVSNEIGAGRPKAARFSVCVAIGITTFQAICVSMTLLGMRNVVGRIFSDNKDVIHYVATIIPIVSITVLTDGLHAVFSGVASGCGWQMLGAYVSLFALYVVGLPVSIVLAFICHMRGKGLWIGITGGLAIQILMLSLITIFTSWKKQSAEAKTRLETIQRLNGFSTLETEIGVVI
eukprot:PITA_34899